MHEQAASHCCLASAQKILKLVYVAGLAVLSVAAAAEQARRCPPDLPWLRRRPPARRNVPVGLRNGREQRWRKEEAGEAQE